MDEDVFATIVGLNKSIALGPVKPLYCTCRHFVTPASTIRLKERQPRTSSHVRSAVFQSNRSCSRAVQPSVRYQTLRLSFRQQWQGLIEGGLSWARSRKPDGAFSAPALATANLSPGYAETKIFGSRPDRSHWPVELHSHQCQAFAGLRHRPQKVVVFFRPALVVI